MNKVKHILCFFFFTVASTMKIPTDMKETTRPSAKCAIESAATTTSGAAQAAIRETATAAENAGASIGNIGTRRGSGGQSAAVVARAG